MAPTSAFVAALQQQLEQHPLDESSQAALLEAVANAAMNPLAAEEQGLESWLGEAPDNPIRLEFQSLQDRFALRRRLLAQTIGATEVAQLLGARSRQTAHDRIKAGTLLAVRDQGHWRFPLWQFDPDGPDGIIDHLPAVIAALPVSDLAKVLWLQSPHPVFSGATPIDWLRKGHGEEVLTEARQVGRGQD
jgi:hypothetical protein